MKAHHGARQRAHVPYMLAPPSQNMVSVPVFAQVAAGPR